jgi:hypothetical protein
MKAPYKIVEVTLGLAKYTELVSKDFQHGMLFHDRLIQS